VVAWAASEMRLSPLRLGSLELPINVVQGPLAGYSCAPFRKLIERFGAVGYTTTEMISAYELAHNIVQPRRYTFKDPDEALLCYQLSGNQPDVLSRAVEKVVSCGADLIDLNCGCPQAKIRKKRQGSRLLCEPEYLYQLLCAMRSAADLPMSAKVRVDGASGESFNREVAEAIVSAGMDFMVVHGRHWQERYDVPVRCHDIAQMVSYADIPVIANGDVSDTASLRTVMEKTQAAGVMISRASLGKPWLLAQIHSECKGEEYIPPDAAERDRIWLCHIRGLIELDGETRALLQARGLAKYYGHPEMAAMVFDTYESFSHYLGVDTI
jgi:tRNA-dihydrouridine synthase B